jgi:hypothetical protein
MQGSAGESVPTTSGGGPEQHRTMLLHRPDGRWEVICLQCLQSRDHAAPIGIGVPIVNRVEAEGIARNHALRVPSI